MVLGQNELEGCNMSNTRGNLKVSISHAPEIRKVVEKLNPLTGSKRINATVPFHMMTMERIEVISNS